MADMPDHDKSEDADVLHTGQRRQWVRDRLTRDRLVAASKRLGRRLFRLGGELVSVLILVGIGALYFANNLASQQTADLTILKPNFERWFSQTFAGARAETGDIQLSWSPTDDSVTFTATDVVVFSDRGEVIQTLDRLQATTTRDSLLARRATIRDVEIVGGEVTWRRNDDGEIVAGLGNSDTVGGFGPVFRGFTEDRNPVTLDWLDEFRSLTLIDSRANILDARDGLDVRIDLESLNGRRDAQTTHLDLVGRLLGEGEAGLVNLEIDSDDALQSVTISLSGTELRPDDLAPLRGRSAPLRGIAMPLNIDFDASYSRQDGVRNANIVIHGESGTVQLAGERRAVESVDFHASLDTGEETMSVETLSVVADRLRLNGSGVIRDIGRINDGDVGTSPRFDLTLNQSLLDLTPVFEDPLRVTSATAVGELDLDTRSLSLDRLTANFGDFALTTRAVIRTNETGLSQVTLIGTTETPMTAPDLLTLWPVNAADGARRWIERSVLDGTLHDVRFAVALDENFFAAPALNPDRLQLEFEVRDGTVNYIRTMPNLTAANGTGKIDGNRFDFDLEEGRIGPVRIAGGTVAMPQLTPKGGDIIINARALGGAGDLLQLINNPPFQYLDRYGVDPNGFSGDADVSLRIKRPLLEFFDPNLIEYSVDGRFVDAAAPFRLGGVGLSDADLSVRGGKEGLFVEGQANLGPWRANVGWAERYGQNGEPTRYHIDGPVSQEVLDSFGLGLRQFFGGSLDLSIDATGRGLNVESARFKADLTPSEISFGQVWSKLAGEPGQFSADLRLTESGYSLSDLSLQAPGLALGGGADLSSTLALQQARLDEAVIEGLIDGRMTLQPAADGRRLQLRAEGQSLDLSDFVRDGLQRAGGQSEGFALILDANFDELRLATDYALENGAISYSHDGVAIERMILEGRREAGPFALQLAQSEGGLSREAGLVIPDLSKAASELLGLSTIEGGRLTASAEMPAAGEAGPILGRANATGFTVRDAPFLAQILSLASLTGFLDTLSGEGLAFDEMDLQFGLQNRVLSVREARLRGPALGMTGDGDIDLVGRTIDFGGALVPSYTANSLLGDIPVIGDIFVGREGEGVFAVNYAIDGPFSAAQISINPLSALTPGFIRGIFREDREDLPDSVIKEIESVRPPSD